MSTSIKPRIRMVTPIWGADYIDRWLGFSFASLRSEGNIPYLNEHCDFELAIVTKAADAALLQSDPRFNAIMSGIRVQLILMDEFFPPDGQVAYGVPLTLAHAKGIADLGSSAVGTYVMLMNADCVLAAGSFRSIVARILEGYTIIVGQSIRAVDGDARRALLSRLDRGKGVLHVEPRELMRLANAHLHSTVTARIINAPGIVDASYYHQMFWRISDDGLAMRAFMLHPICFRIERAMEKVVCPMDYGFLLELCPHGRFCVLDDSDAFLIIELQARDSESHLLRVAGRDATLDRRLRKLAGEITAVATAWTTSEHRRAATRTIYFHAEDLPADLPQRAAPFEAFVDTLLTGLPPPVSHVRHPHWLPAVQIYRNDMMRGGGSAAVALLDDPRNMPVPTDLQIEADKSAPRPAQRPLVESARPVFRLSAGGAEHERRARLAAGRAHLGSVVSKLLADDSEPLEIAYIADVGEFAPPPPSGVWRQIHVRGPGAQSAAGPLSVRIPDPQGRTSTLLVYAAASFLWSWEQFEQDLDRYVGAGRSRVIIVLVVDEFRSVAFASHSYVLSILATTLLKPKYASALRIFALPEPFGPSGEGIGSHDDLAQHACEPATAVVWDGEGDPPSIFSTLIVSIEPAPHASPSGSPGTA